MNMIFLSVKFFLNKIAATKPATITISIDIKNIKLAPLLNLCVQIAVGDGIGGEISRILTVWMEETQVSHLNSHVNSVEENVPGALKKECMGTNTVFRISSKGKSGQNSLTVFLIMTYAVQVSNW